eukprot:7014605-Karenia_brevis.AAC.1
MRGMKKLMGKYLRELKKKIGKRVGRVKVKAPKGAQDVVPSGGTWLSNPIVKKVALGLKIY